MNLDLSDSLLHKNCSSSTPTVWQACIAMHGNYLLTIDLTTDVMSPSTLNVDVLAIACEFLTDVSDILSFAHTCSILRPVAIRWLLSMKPIDLKDGTSVRRFHSFLFADPPARTPHLRALSIAFLSRTIRPLPTFPGDSSLLKDILTSCPHLDDVSIFLQDGSHGCTDDPQVIEAIVSIQGLRSLSIYGWSIRAFDLLRGLRAPIRMLHIGFQNTEIDFWSPGALEMLLPRSLMPTLEKLRLCNFVTDLYDTQVDTPIPGKPPVPSRPYLDMPTYPAIRSLHLNFVLRRPLLDHLQHFFPALDGTLSLGFLDTTLPDGDAHYELRAVNQRAQETVQGGNSRSRAWQKLDKLICDPRMFFVLGLRCPIRFLVLDNGSAFTKWFAAIGLRANPVPRLKLSFYLNEGSDVLDGLFTPELARVLTHLTVCLLFANDSGIWSDADPETIGHLQWEDLLVSTPLSLGSSFECAWPGADGFAHRVSFLRRTRSFLPSGPYTNSPTSGSSSRPTYTLIRPTLSHTPSSS